MSRQKRSIKENNDKLKVQLELLRSCTEHFDSGMIHMALPMATQFRVLIHQTDKSNSRNGTLSTAITICGEINQTRQLIA
ncbi:hypothetical protein ME792_01550 [Lactobacillus delbrueckii]|nr:hypothetical protein ME792_01550 [Lactobacillus delbrueckii]